MKYWVVYDDYAYPAVDDFHPRKIIAYHESRKVCEKYKEYTEFKDEEKCRFVIFKVKESVIKEIQNYYDYYLIRFGNTYVQSKFIGFFEYEYETRLKEICFTKEILMRFLEFSELSKKETNHITKVCELLERQKEEIKSDIPSFKALKIMEMEREIEQNARSSWGFDVDDDSSWD